MSRPLQTIPYSVWQRAYKMKGWKERRNSAEGVLTYCEDENVRS
jgi:hypothetical protein